MANYKDMSADEILQQAIQKSQGAGQSNAGSGGSSTGGGSNYGGFSQYAHMSAGDILNAAVEKASGTGFQRYTDWVSRYRDTMQKVSAFTNQRNGGWTSDAFGGYRSAMDRLIGQYEDVASGLDQRDASRFKRYYNGLKSLYDSLDKSNQFYGQFKNQDDYDRKRSGYSDYGVGYRADGWNLTDEEARRLRQQQFQNDQNAVGKAKEEYEAAKVALGKVNNAYAMATNNRYTGTYDKEKSETLYDQLQTAKERFEQAEVAYYSIKNRLDAYNAGWGRVDQYADVRKAAEGTQGSYQGPGYQELSNWENRMQNYLAGQEAYPGKSPETEDLLGLYLSMDEEQRSYAAGSNNKLLTRAVLLGNGGHWDLLNSDEISAYYYLRKSQGQKAADNYLADMETELGRRKDLLYAQDVQNADGLALAGLNAISVVDNVLGALPAAGAKARELITGDANLYGNAQGFRRRAKIVRTETDQRIQDSFSDSQWLQDKVGEQWADRIGSVAGRTYQAMMSGIDSAAGAMLFGQGAGFGVGPFTMHIGGYSTVMGMGAFAQRAQELQAQGASRGQIAVGAVGAGILETIFEDISMEAFFKNVLDNPNASFWKKLKIQTGVEASEEMFTEIGNMVLDAINLGKQCDNQRRILEYVASGLSYNEAVSEATRDAAMDIFWAGFGGAVSAGGMASVGQTVSGTMAKVDSARSNYYVGSKLFESGDASALVEQAQGLSDAKARKKLVEQAKQAQKAQKDGYNDLADRYQAGRTANRIAQEAAKEGQNARRDAFRGVAAQYLKGQEGIQNKKKALDVLTKAYMGEKLLTTERSFYNRIGGQKLLDAVTGSVEEGQLAEAEKKIQMQSTMKVADTIGAVMGSKSASELRKTLDISSDGITRRKDTMDPVNIRGISRVENGKLLLLTDDGEVDANSLSYGTYEDSQLFGALSGMNIDTETAKRLLEAAPETDRTAYAAGIKSAYLSGYVGAEYGQTHANGLTEDQKKLAYDAGQNAAMDLYARRVSAVKSRKMQTAKGGLRIHESVDMENLNDAQKAAMPLIQALANSGLPIELYASTEAERKAGKENGSFAPDGTIRLDINAGDNGQGAVAYALAHEITHFAEKYSPEKFQALAELLRQEAKKQGDSFAELVERKAMDMWGNAEYKGLSQDKLLELSKSEVIAEMCETILSDTDAAARLSQKLQAQDKGLWEKIKDFFTGLVEKLKEAYRSLNPDSQIARSMKEAVIQNEAVLNAWVDAVSEGVENFNLQDGINKSAPGDVKHSLRKNGEFMQMAIDINNRNGFVEDSVMRKASQVRDAIANIMMDPKLQESLGLPADIEGNTFFPDSSYGGTEENTTICPRSMGAEALLDAVSDFLGRPLTVDEQIVVSQEMQGLTANPECVYCYVATDRKAYREFLGEYIKQRDWVLENAKKYTDTKTYTSDQISRMTEQQKGNSLYVQFLNGRKPTRNMASRFKMWMDTSRSGKQLLQASDLSSIYRLESLRAENFANLTKEMADQIKDAMRYAQSASWAKKRVGYTAYNGHILKWKQSRIDNLNSQYGLRMYSFSDFSPAFILENMQMVTDAATRGLKMLAYTKDLNFVKIFAGTGMNINVSCFGFEADGKVYENNLQGASWAEAKKLREQNPNVGVVFMAYNDNMVKWAMQQDWVDVVIPYHLVRTGTKVAEAFGFTNYTDISGDKKITESWVKGKNVDHVTPPMHGNNLEMYLAACEKNNLQPRFQKFLEDPDNRPYYMKLVNETRRSAAETPTVQPIFDQRAAEIALQDMRNNGGYFQPIGGSVDRTVEIAMEIAGKIQDGQKNYAHEGVIKYSSRSEDVQRFNPDGKTLSEQLGDILQTSKSFDGRYLYLGRFSEKFIHDISEFVIIRDLPIVMNYRDAYLAMESKENGRYQGEGINYHDLGEDGMELAINSLDNPVAVMRSKKNPERIEFVLNCTDKKGNKILSIIQMNTSAQNSGEFIEAHVTTSIYGRRNIEKYINKADEEGRVWNGNKEEPAQGIPQVQYKGDINADSSVSKIPYSNQEVNGIILESSRSKLSQETKDALDSYKAQRDAVDKANKAMYEAERSKIEQAYRREMKDLESRYSAEVADIQKAFFSLVRNYEAKVDEAGAAGAKVAELSQALQEEIDSHSIDKKQWEEEFSRLLKEYDKLNGKTSDRISALQEKVEHQRDAAKAKVESRRKTETRQKIQNKVNTLNRMLLHPTRDVHVPDGMQQSVTLAMQAINGAVMASKDSANAKRLQGYYAELTVLARDPAKNADAIRAINDKVDRLTQADANMKNALGKLAEQYKKLQKTENPVYDKVVDELIQEAFEGVGDKQYSELSLTDLKKIYDAYSALLKTIRNANKNFRAGRTAKVSDNVQKFKSEMATRKRKDKESGAMGKAVGQFMWNNLKPVFAFDRIGSTVLSELYENIRQGEDTWAVDVTESKAFFLGTADRYGYSEWDFDTLQEYESASGKKFQLNLEERMSLYAYSLREQASEHLRQGGIVLDENTSRPVENKLGWKRNMVYNDANAYNLTDETINAIVSSLTPQQRAFAREMQQYLSVTMAEKGNAVSLELYDIKLFEEENYWPLKSNLDYMARAQEAFENPVNNRPKNWGGAKKTTPGANNPIVLTGFMETWANHINEMSMYHAFTLPMEDFYRVYNWNDAFTEENESFSVKSLLIDVCGRDATNYIDTFLKDINGGVRADPRDTTMNAMLSGFKKAAVSASLSVAIQQPSSIGRAFCVIDPKYFVGRKIDADDKSWEQCKQYAPVAILKEMGRFDMDMGKGTIDYIMGDRRIGTWDKVTGTIDDAAGKLPEMADQMTWCAIWEAAKRQTADTHFGLQGEALLQEAGKLFTECITKTQVYDSVFSRSANMRNKSVAAKMVTAFMAEPTTTANMVEYAARKFARGERGMAVKVMASVATATVLNALLASIVYAARDDDKNLTYWEKYLSSFTGEMMESLNPMTYLPILSDINSLLMGYSVNRTDLSLAQDIINSFRKTAQLYGQYDEHADEADKEEWKANVRNAWVNTLFSVGTVMGLPLKNVYRDVMAAYNTITNPSKDAPVDKYTILEAVLRSVKKNVPVWNWMPDDSYSDKLYDAVTSGKTLYASRIRSRYKTTEAADRALLNGLKENDPRIRRAAEYRVAGDTKSRVDIIKEIKAEGYFTQDQIIKAVNQLANTLEADKPNGPEKHQYLYDAEEWVNAKVRGLGYADEAREMIIATRAENYRIDNTDLPEEKARKKAEKSFTESARGEIRYRVKDMTMDSDTAVKLLMECGCYGKEENAKKAVRAWIIAAEVGDNYFWDQEQYLDWGDKVKPSNLLTLDAYDNYLEGLEYVHGEDKDGDGNNDPYTYTQALARYINSMPLSKEQKDLLFSLKVTNQKTFRKYKLW